MSSNVGRVLRPCNNLRRYSRPFLLRGKGVFGSQTCLTQSPKAVPIRSRLFRWDSDASIDRRMESMMTNSPSPTPTQTHSVGRGRRGEEGEGEGLALLRAPRVICGHRRRSVREAVKFIVRDHRRRTVVEVEWSGMMRFWRSVHMPQRFGVIPFCSHLLNNGKLWY